MTYLSLSPVNAEDRCGERSALFSSLPTFVPRLSQLRYMDMFLPTDVDAVWSICCRLPMLVVRDCWHRRGPGCTLNNK